MDRTDAPERLADGDLRTFIDVKRFDRGDDFVGKVALQDRDAISRT